MLKVVVIPGKFEQIQFRNFWIFNITLGLMKKYIAFYEALREIAKYVGNLMDFCRIMRIPRVCAMMRYNFWRSNPDSTEAHPSYNFRQKRRLAKQNPLHFAARH